MWLWDAVASAGKQSAPHPRLITTPTPQHSIFTGRMLFLAPNQQHQGTEGNDKSGNIVYLMSVLMAVISRAGPTGERSYPTSTCISSSSSSWWWSRWRWNVWQHLDDVQTVYRPGKGLDRKHQEPGQLFGLTTFSGKLGNVGGI